MPVCLSTESCNQQSVSAVQCTQNTDSHSQLVPLPARNTHEIPGLVKLNDSTPGCWRFASAVDRQPQMSDFPGNREAAAAAAVDHDESNCSDVRGSSAVPSRRRTAASTAAQPQTPVSSAAVPPSTSMPRHHKRQQQQLPGSLDQPISSSSCSLSPVSGHQPRRHTSHTQTSLAAVDGKNMPLSLRISTAG